MRVCTASVESVGYTIACDVDQEIIGERQWARRSRSATAPTRLLCARSRPVLCHSGSRTTDREAAVDGGGGIPAEYQRGPRDERSRQST